MIKDHGGVKATLYHYYLTDDLKVCVFFFTSSLKRLKRARKKERIYIIYTHVVVVALISKVRIQMHAVVDTFWP